jgi:WXG100 family type VII secretion target
MTRLVVDVSLLDQLVAEMAAYDDRLGTRCAGLLDRLHCLHADWRGAAAADQAAAQQQLMSAMKQMTSTLLRLRAAAETAAANYAASAAANGQIWGSRDAAMSDACATQVACAGRTLRPTRRG